MAAYRKMHSFIIGCSVVAVALAALAYVAIYPYMGSMKLSPLPVDSVADRSLPPVMADSEREQKSQPPLPVATDSQTGKATTSARGPAEARQENVTRSKSATASIVSPAPSPCGPGLAAQDLAGECRAKPCPTMGALEIPGAASAKPPCRADTITRKPSTRNKQGRKTKNNKRRQQGKKKRKK